MDRSANRLIGLLFLATAAAIGLAIVFLSSEVAGALVTAILLAVVAVLVTRKLAPAEDRDFLPMLLGWALLAKIAATFVRLYINEAVYGGGDSNRIASAASRIAIDMRSLDFSSFTAHMDTGTEFSESMAALLFSFFGDSFITGSFLYAFLAFLGSVFLYRAFRIALPEGNRKLLAVLLFFYPTILYWPTGIGKDAAVFFFLGLSVWGAMKFSVKSHFIGILWAIAGAAGMFYIRPEIGLIAASATVAGLMVRASLGKRQRLIWRIFTVMVMAVAVGVLVNRGLAFVGVQDFSADAVFNVVIEQSSQVFDEGRQSSNFTPPQVMTPEWIPMAIITVLFRPFPWEANNLQSLAQSFESLALGVLFLVSLPRILQGIIRHWNNPLVVYSLVFVLLAVIALATLGNFGLLARQRAVVFPFLFFIMTAAPVAAARAGEAMPRAHERSPLPAP